VSATGGGLYQSDWHHPTAPGHRLIADTVFDALKRDQLLRR
jgi:phospholipase/lecithinase/hemolysin